MAAPYDLKQLGGISKEKTTQGLALSISYVGTKAECERWQSEHAINSTDANGKLTSVSVDQYGGAIYRVTAKYINVNGDSGIGYATTPPDYTYGKYSAQLDGGMLSTPLEQHKDANGNADYKTCWNYYLAARDDTAWAIPAWATTATDTVLTGADAETYRWISSPSEKPQNDSLGHYWAIIQNPTMPGITSFDVATYTQTESARFRSYAAAAASVAAKLNVVYTHPPTDPGFTGGSWKCDRATISWTGDYWLATLTYTYSAAGWNTTLYNTPVNPS